MVAAALVISCVALLLSGLVALAVMELIADRPARLDSTDDDVIQELELSPAVAGTEASSHGLPQWLDHTTAHVALVVSPMCAACAAMVRSFEGVVPDGVTVVVTASGPQRQREWAAMLGLPPDEAIYDNEMSVVNSLGVTSSPTAVGFGGGRVIFMMGIGGRRALDTLLDRHFQDLQQGTPINDASEKMPIQDRRGASKTGRRPNRGASKTGGRPNRGASKTGGVRA